MESQISTLTIVLRLFLAAVLGGLIGYERESHGQAAGLRTNIIVAIGACLMMLLSLHMEELYRGLSGDTAVRLDPSRIASYAIASMGFLGAGAIIKGQSTVRGLTTAAGLWLVTGVGLAIGAGYLLAAVVTTAVSALTLFWLPRIARPFITRDLHTMLTVVCECDHTRFRQIKEVLEGHPTMRVSLVTCSHDFTTNLRTYRMRLKSKEIIDRSLIMRQLLDLGGFRHMTWDEAGVP
jgi:putative Mg2+ transporter-C (MgtC) family protein